MSDEMKKELAEALISSANEMVAQGIAASPEEALAKMASEVFTEEEIVEKIKIESQNNKPETPRFLNFLLNLRPRKGKER